MDVTTICITSPPLVTPPVKALSSSVAGGSSSNQNSHDGRDRHMGSTNDSAPFVLIEDLDLEAASQHSATISFWFPRPGQENTNELSTQSRRQRRAPQWRAVDRDSTTAIQPGSPIDIFATKNLGLLVSFAAVGYFQGVLPLLIQALYSDGSTKAKRIVSGQHVVQLLRLVFALLSDTVLPAARHRRRIFLVLGWGFTLLISAILASVTSSSSQRSGALDEYMPLLLALHVGVMVASVSTEGLMVEYAHREDLQERGCIQMLLLATRIVGQLIGRSSLSTGSAPTAGAECMGEIDCIIELKYTFVIAAAIALPALLGSACMTRVTSRRRLALQGYAAATALPTKLRLAWNFHQHAAYLAFVAFGFIQAASIALISPSTKELAASSWLGLSSNARWISDGVNCSLQMVAALLLMSLLRNTNWRTLTLVLAIVSTVLTRLPSEVVLLYGTTKSHAVLLGSHHVASFAEILMTMVRLLVAVEMAMPTMEATSYTLTTSAFDLGTVVGSFAPKELATLRANVHASRSIPAADWVIASCVFLHVARLTVDLSTLRMLPQQKACAREQRENEQTQNSFALGLALATLAVLLLAAAALSVRSIVDGTTGLPWANAFLITHYSISI